MRLLLILVLAALAGCGFQLRGTAELPFDTLYLPSTGGIGLDTAPAYLSIPDVVAVGGSWMVPANRLAAGDWPAVRDLAAACIVLRGTVAPLTCPS